jgi:chorismate mutase
MGMQDNLEPLRKRVNDIDQQIVQLINARAKVCLEIGAIKKTIDKKVYDPTRERAVLDLIDEHNAGPLDKGALESIYAAVFSACREIQASQS